jgi:isopentenyl phosphate kinase
MNPQPIFLKLGGSLITNKDKPYTTEPAILDRISLEIHQFLQASPQTRIIIGHGSGSFGHTSGSLYRTRNGVFTPEDWEGYQKVCTDARALNQIVISSLVKAGSPAISFPPSTQVITSNHTIQEWNITPIQLSLEHGLIPVVFGDTVLDISIGGTILSTEDLFIHLAAFLQPSRILLAGIEDGVWASFPDRTHIIPKITPHNLIDIKNTIGASASPDVTGGMTSKIDSMLALLSSQPDASIHIFSGLQPNSIFEALSGKEIGTVITSY